MRARMCVGPCVCACVCIYVWYEQTADVGVCGVCVCVCVCVRARACVRACVCVCFHEPGLELIREYCDVCATKALYKDNLILSQSFTHGLLKRESQPYVFVSETSWRKCAYSCLVQIFV